MKKRIHLVVMGTTLALVLALAGIWAASAHGEWPPIEVDLAIQKDGHIVTATVWVKNTGDVDTDILTVKSQVPEGAKYLDSWAGGRGFHQGVFDGRDVGWTNEDGVKAGKSQGPFVYMFDISSLDPGADSPILAWVKWAGQKPGTAASKAVSVRIAPPAAMGPAPVAPEPMPMPPAGPAAPPPAAAFSPEMLAEGRALFAKSCAACHGANGEGTAIGPKIAGHSIAATKTQVRNPVGSMPAFTAAQLSDADLEKVASFILSLGPALAPAADWETAAPETIHHWMALLAIKTNDIGDARTHLEEALTFVAEPKHRTDIRTDMEKALDLMVRGELYDAEDLIEEMAGAESPSGVTIQRFHLILVQRAVDEMNAAEARRHLERFAIKATDQQKALVREALEKIDANDFHEAEHEVEELLES